MNKLIVLGLLISLNCFAGDPIPRVSQISSNEGKLSIAIDEQGVHFSANQEGADLLKQRVILTDEKGTPMDLVLEEVNVIQSSERWQGQGIGHVIILKSVIKSREAGSGMATGRRSGSIILVGREGTEVLRFNFTNASPSKVKIVIDRDTGRIIEEIEFVVEKIERA